MVTRYTDKGYNKNQVQKTGLEVAGTSREAIRKPEEKRQENSLMYISTYDKHAGMVKNIIKKRWNILQADRKYRKLYKQFPKLVYSRGRTLGNRLVRADLLENITSKQTFLRTQNSGTYACLSCQHCASIIKQTLCIL